MKRFPRAIPLVTASVLLAALTFWSVRRGELPTRFAPSQVSIRCL